MAIKISVVSEKGGVGKTVSTTNIAGGLARLGKKVLAVDLDQQQNLSATLGFVKDGNPTVSELIYNAVADFETDYQTAIRHSESGVDYIPSSTMLTNITSTMANDTESNYILKRIFDNEIFNRYDYILFDCRTLLDLLVSNAMNASDYVIIPVESGIYAYDGLEKMIGKVSSINNSTNRKLRILGILLNKQQRTNISASVAESIKSDYESITFKTGIPYCPAQTEQAIIRKEISVFDNRSSLGQAYSKVAEEILTKINNVQ